MNNNYEMYEGGQTIEIPVDIESIPMFLREGAIVAFADDQPMNLAKDQVKELHLYLEPSMPGSCTLYNDDGVSNDYKDGAFKKTHISMHGKEVVDVGFSFEGTFEDTVEKMTVEMIRKEKCPFGVEIIIDGKAQRLAHFLNSEKFEKAAEGWYYNMTDRTVLVKYANPGKDYTLRVSFENFDVIGM